MMIPQDLPDGAQFAFKSLALTNQSTDYSIREVLLTMLESTPEEHRQRAFELHEWSAINDREDIPSLKAFFSEVRHPDVRTLISKQIAQIEAVVREREQQRLDRTLWTAAVEQDCLEAYAKYLSLVSDPLNRDSAQQRLAELRDSKLASLLEEAGVTDDFESWNNVLAFVLKWNETLGGIPDSWSRAMKLAEERQEAVWWNYAVAENTVSAFEAYLTNSRLQTHTKRAKALRDELYKKDEALWLEMQDCKDTSERYCKVQQYLQDSVSLCFKSEAQREITTIEQEEESLWTETLNACSEAALDNYLRATILGFHIEDCHDCRIDVRLTEDELRWNRTKASGKWERYFDYIFRNPNRFSPWPIDIDNPYWQRQEEAIEWMDSNATYVIDAAQTGDDYRLRFLDGPVMEFAWLEPGTIEKKSYYDHDRKNILTLDRGIWFAKMRTTSNMWNWFMPQFAHISSAYYVEGVNFQQISVWMELLTRFLRSVKAIPESYMLDIPNFVEWQYAAYAGTAPYTIYPWGDNTDEDLGLSRWEEKEEHHRALMRYTTPRGIEDLFANKYQLVQEGSRLALMGDHYEWLRVKRLVMGLFFASHRSYTIGRFSNIYKHIHELSWNDGRKTTWTEESSFQLRLVIRPEANDNKNSRSISGPT